MASSSAIPPTDDDELTLPRASINKMIKEILPNIRVANESRELILNCCTEFIHLLSSEANDICNSQQKKTINSEHVLLGEKVFFNETQTAQHNQWMLFKTDVHLLTALDRLGFGDYIPDADAVLQNCKAVAAQRKKQSTRLENLGIPEEELLRQQQELFARAREEQAAVEQQQWQHIQNSSQAPSLDNEEDDYC